MTERLGPWRLPLAWALVILVATSVPLPTADWRSTGLPLDKLAHGVLYLGLGWGSARALRRSRRSGVAPVLLMLGAGMLFAAADEAHQGWLVWRTPSVADWLADVAGLAAGLVLGAAMTRSTGPQEAESKR